MGKSQFLLLNPQVVRAHDEAGRMIGVQEVRISIRARRFDSLHQEAGYMTDAYSLSKKSLDSHGRSIHDNSLYLLEKYHPEEPPWQAQDLFNNTVDDF